MAGPFLDADARTGFARAVATIEAASGAEVVVAVRRRSATYLHAHVIAGVVAAFVGLTAMLFSEHEFALEAIWIEPFVVGGIAGGLVALVPGLQRLLTPAAWRHREVVRAARATFVERGVHHTRERTGLLVYISWLEREIAVVFDGGLERRLSTNVRERASRTLTAAMARGGAAVARELEQLRDALAAAAPHRDDDINELPDAIDSDLPEPGRGAR